MKNYTIEKIDKNVKMKGQDQDGNEQEIKVERYTINVEGIDRKLDILIRQDSAGADGKVIEGIIDSAVEEALKNLPEDFKEKKI